MKEFLYRLFACFMALLVLVSTTSWKVEKHYCMGRLMDFSFFGQVEDCGMDMDHKDPSVSVDSFEDACCANEVVVLEGQKDATSVCNDFDLGKQQSLLAHTLSFFEIPLFSEAQVSFFNSYHPPKLVKDIQLLDEVYLI